MASWWNDTGGLAYHFIAWRQKRAWRAFCLQIREFLESHVPNNGNLLLVGPSGGYTLPTQWLSGFQQISAIDPDPLAPFFFRRNHPRLKVTWSRHNYLFDHERQWRTEGLSEIIGDYPNHLLFFTNLVGQLPLLLKQANLQDEDTWKRWQQDWREALARQRWVSIHDLFSSAQAPNPPLNRDFSGLEKDQLVNCYYGGNQSVTVTDHLTYDLLPTADVFHRYAWPLYSNQIHLVEAAVKSC